MISNISTERLYEILAQAVDHFEHSRGTVEVDSFELFKIVNHLILLRGKE
jgi:hypothetical protein